MADAPAEGVWKRFEQIQVKCTMSMCDADLHCFRLTKKLSEALAPGTCKDCGRTLVSFERTAARDLGDVDATFIALQRECIRHYFWHVPFGQKAFDYALRKGRIELENCIEKRIRDRVGRAAHPAEGRQTPVDRARADALDYGLHAVAACCRRCANYWHGILTDRPLTDEEVFYLSELVRRYLRARLPHLPAGPTKVPRRSRKASVSSLPSTSGKTAAEKAVSRRPHAS